MIDQLREYTQELKDLHDKYYKIFDELKEAGPSLERCDEAFIEMAHNITEQYKLEFALLDLTQRNEVEQEIARLKAIHDRVIPNRWKTRFLHRKKQNYAATLVDIEADEKAARFYAECEAYIAELAAEHEARIAELEAMQLAEAQRLAESAENAQDGQEVENTEQGAENASEGNSEGGEATGKSEDEKPVESASDKAMKEYLNKKKRKKGKDKQSDKSN